MYCESYQTYKLRKLGVSNLAKRDKYLGKPYEGKPHVRFDEGSRETGWQHYCALVLLYNLLTLLLNKSTPLINTGGVFLVIFLKNVTEKIKVLRFLIVRRR